MSFLPALAMVRDDRLGRGTVSQERDSGFFVAGVLVEDMVLGGCGLVGVEFS